jgi:hypothetical protein
LIRELEKPETILRLSLIIFYILEGLTLTSTQFWCTNRLSDLKVVENIVRLCIKKRFVFRRVVAASIAVKAILTDMKDARAEIWILDTYKGHLTFKFFDKFHL